MHSPRNSAPGDSHVENSVRKIPSLCADRPERPDLAEPPHHPGAHLVQRGSARWQPGTHRADESGAQAPHVRAAREAWLQGNRSRLSGGLADRFRFRPRTHRARPDPRGCDHSGADAGAPGNHRAHLRGAGRRAARDRACLQLHLDHAAARGLQARPRRHQGHRGAWCRMRAPRSRARGRHRVGIPVQPRELHGHRTGLCGGSVRRGDPGVGAHAAAQGHPESAGHRRDGHAEHLRRPDRMVLSACRPPRQRHHQRPPAQ